MAFSIPLILKCGNLVDVRMIAKFRNIPIKLVREPVCLQFANGPFSLELPTQEIGVTRSHMDSDPGAKLPLFMMASFMRESSTGERF